MISKKDVSRYFAKFGRKGGRATRAKLTPEQRSEIARKASQARWAKTNVASAEPLRTANQNLTVTLHCLAEPEKRSVTVHCTADEWPCDEWQ